VSGPGQKAISQGVNQQQGVFCMPIPEPETETGLGLGHTSGRTCRSKTWLSRLHKAPGLLINWQTGRPADPAAHSSPLAASAHKNQMNEWLVLLEAWAKWRKNAKQKQRKHFTTSRTNWKLFFGPGRLAFATLQEWVCQTREEVCLCRFIVSVLRYYNVLRSSKLHSVFFRMSL